MKEAITFLKDKVNEKGAREAVKLYYQRFGTDKSLTVNEAAHIAGVTGLEAHLYMANTNGLGMPDNREYALRYLKKLQGLDRQSFY